MSSRALTNNNSLTTLIVGIAIIAAIVYFLRKSNQTIAGVNNLETWSWEDWRGRQRQITVHRDVKVSSN